MRRIIFIAEIIGNYLELPCHSKVPKFQCARFRQEHVGILDVPMYDTTHMQVIEAEYSLCQPRHNGGLINGRI